MDQPGRCGGRILKAAAWARCAQTKLNILKKGCRWRHASSTPAPVYTSLWNGYVCVCVCLFVFIYGHMRFWCVWRTPHLLGSLDSWCVRGVCVCCWRCLHNIGSEWDARQDSTKFVLLDDERKSAAQEDMAQSDRYGWVLGGGGKELRVKGCVQVKNPFGILLGCLVFDINPQIILDFGIWRCGIRDLKILYIFPFWYGFSVCHVERPTLPVKW